MYIVKRTCGKAGGSTLPQSSSWSWRGAGVSASPCLPSLPADGLPGSAQQVIQVDRDTVLVCFDRCVRIVNLLGEPTATLAPVLTFDFPIETVGE